MTAPAQTICLSMIVKNEAPVIRRCLASIRGMIDCWAIVDTGSTDGTQDIVRETLADLPGELFERPWRNFAHNRSEALTLARPRADYTLIIDADDALEIPSGFVRPELTADCYALEIRDTALQYRRPQLVRNTLPWRYEGVLHEFLAVEGAGPEALLEGPFIRRNHDGARRRDPLTYRRDAQILEEALEGETSEFFRARYTFYLAQSFRDCGENAKALEHYLARAELGLWQEEVFCSLYQAAKIKEQLGHPDQEVIDAYLRASDALPTRAEALHGASRFCRFKGQNAEGYEIAKRGLNIALRSDALFVEPWIYETGLLDEYAINAYWSGHYRDCLDASLKMLATGKVAPHDVGRVVANARFASERMPVPKEPNLGTMGREGLIEQHALVAPRQLHSRVNDRPRVLIAILAKQKEPSLPLYLECIEALDYPKSSIVLYIRTNNNTDRTEEMLRAWVARVGHLYAEVEFNATNVEEAVETFGVHEWNPTRFSVLARIRNASLRRAIDAHCAFYFVCDVDNFIRPCTLRELVSLNLPIVAPFLRSIKEGHFYSNYHAEVDANGYYKDCDQYYWILNRHVRGIIEVPVVHCTYLVRTDFCADLSYQDSTTRFEYVIFSDCARKKGIIQYLDNRQIYGYITFDEGGIIYSADGVEKARDFLTPELKQAKALPNGCRVESACDVRLAELHSAAAAMQNDMANHNTHSDDSSTSLHHDNHVNWMIEGVFTGVSGIARSNRNLASALHKACPGRISIKQIGGSLSNDPDAVREGLPPLEVPPGRPIADLLVYQHWILQPPSQEAKVRVALVWWETTRLFERDVTMLNRNYHAVFAPSSFVADALKKSGISIPICNVGFGYNLEKYERLRTSSPTRQSGSPYTFLHVSDCHPRKGAELLVDAFLATFDQQQNVKLIVKAHDNAFGQAIQDYACKRMPEPVGAPAIAVIAKSVSEEDLLALYQSCDCVVLPTRGEGLCLPAIEAICAGKHLIITGHGGHMDFVSAENARLVDYRLQPATGYFSTDEALWAEPNVKDLNEALQDAFEQRLTGRQDANHLVEALSMDQWARRLQESAATLRATGRDNSAAL